MRQLISELKRRNIFRVSGVYVVVSWIIIQIAVAVEAPLSLPGWTDTMVIILLALGLPITMVFTWAFEITPEGLRRTRIVEDDALNARLRITDGLLAVLIVALIGVSAAPYLAHWNNSDLEPTTRSPSIAVLPFVDMSPDKDQEYFSDGISEEILNVLAKTPGLQVAARTSSFAFKGQDQDIRKIGETLDVAHVLEGSIRKFGDRIRITAQLIRADNGYHLWSETYDRSLADIFALQDEISGQILSAMEVHLLGQKPASRSNQNLEAYDLYLRGKHLQSKRTKENLLAAVPFFKEAVALAPDFAEGHAALALNYMLLRRGTGNYGEFTNAQARNLAMPHYEKARQLAPELPEAHALSNFLGNTPQEVLAGLDRAIELNPNYAEALVWRSSYKINHVNFSEGLRDLEKAREIDPLSLLINTNTVLLNANFGNLGNAKRAAQTLASIAPNSPLTGQSQVIVNMMEGNFSKALLIAINLERNGDSTLNTRAWLSIFLSGLGFYSADLVSDEENEIRLYWQASERWSFGHIEAAATFSKKIQETHADDPFSIIQYAGLLNLQGRQEEARKLLEPMIASGNQKTVPPCMPDLQIVLVELQLEKELIQTGRLCGPRFDTRRANLSWEVLQRGFAYFAIRGEVDKAVALLEGSVKKGAPMLFGDMRKALPYIADDPRVKPLLKTLDQRASQLRKTLLSELQVSAPEVHAQILLAAASE
ncbi:invasion protein regulator [Microbulbifer aggregans]|uniref:Invasion protein regulator n=1 Tax=Microbulbifer aggregans TaxID=1769779 RepID=A0A1C9W321_9GAMM|nr:hypothetical protein [Microbulbifer aggregans]AOS95548.1 invasion protein regulator [Microbulbifer aggregans]